MPKQSYYSDDHEPHSIGWDAIIGIAFAAGVGLIVSLFLFWLFCLNHVRPQEIGVAYNSLDGSIHIQENPGWYRTSPFVSVSTIDLRPVQVCIGGNGARILNCKLIRFKAEGVMDFIKLQGFSHGGWNSNTGMCVSSGESNRCTGLTSILMSYAFSNEPTPAFLEIMEEIKSGLPKS